MVFAEVSLDKVREYWDRRPCNVRHSSSEFGTRQYFDEVERRKYFVEPHIPGFAEFPRWNGKRVLEIGCGIGTDTMNFARAGARVVAIDLSFESLKIAQRRAEVLGLRDRIQFYQADAERLSESVPAESYDLVYSFGVIHHTPHPENVLREIHRHYVRPGSTVKIMVYHRYSTKAIGLLIREGKGAFWKFDEITARHSEAQTGCPVTYSYSKPQARRLFEGLEVRRMQIEHIFPYRIAEYVRYQYRKQWYFQAMPASFFRWLERHWGWHLCVTAEAK